MAVSDAADFLETASLEAASSETEGVEDTAAHSLKPTPAEAGRSDCTPSRSRKMTHLCLEFQTGLKLQRRPTMFSCTKDRAKTFQNRAMSCESLGYAVPEMEERRKF